MPTVIETADRFRNQLRSKETSATNDLLTAYRGVTNRLEDKLTVLQAKIELLEKNGNLTPENVRKLAVWGSLLNQVEDEITKYGGYVATQNKVAAQSTIDMASKHSKLLTQTYFNDNPNLVKAFNASWDTLPAETIETLVGFLRPDSNLVTNLERTLGRSATQNFQDKLLEGISLGYGSKKINSLINQTLSEPLTWSINTVRTTQNYAYRETTRANYVNNSEIVGGWKWYAALDGRVCLSCVNQHGRDFPTNARLNDHHQGRCTQIPLIDKPERFGLKSPDVELGEQWFNKLPKTEQINRMGIDRHAAYRAGKFKFTDLSETYQNDSFGEMLKEASLKSILGKVKPTKPKRQPKPVVNKPSKKSIESIPDNLVKASDRLLIEGKHPSEYLNNTLKEIESIHYLLKEFSGVPVKYETELTDAYGTYKYAGKDPVSIIINESKQKDITLAHEFGHFIDHQLNKNSFGVYASEYSDLFADWRNAVESTKSMKTLRDMRANPDKYIKDLDGYEFRPSFKETDYFLSYREVWARSYAQYIAQSNPRMKSQIQDILQEPIYNDRQWDDEDFQIVKQSIDKLLITLGLKK